MAVAVVGSACTIIVTTIMVMRASILMMVFVVECRVIGPRSPADFFLVALFGLFSIGVLVGHLEHLADQCRWPPIELPSKLVVMIEPVDETGDYFGFKDVRNLVSYFREAPDVASKELSYPLVDPSQVMLCC